MKTSLPETRHPLKHAGTDRFGRMSAELSLDYVQIEERHEAEFLEYAARLAAAFHFYTQDNVPLGNWQAFFDASVPEQAPHKALFIAFLRLLEALNEHLNGLTGRHLDFYYREVLCMMEQQARPDLAHVVFTCAQTLNERFIARNTAVEAGESADGKTILFNLVDEIVVNRAAVRHVFSVFRHDESYGSRLFSRDYSTLLAQAETNEKGFPLFGEPQLQFVKQGGVYIQSFRDVPNLTMDQAEIGCAVTSSLLLLEEGSRTISLRFELDSMPVSNLKSGDLVCDITTAEGWFRLSGERMAIASQQPGEIKFLLKLNETDPAVAIYNREIHQGNYHTTHPVLRMQFAHEATPFAYAVWENILLKKVFLSTEVKGIRSLIVQNDLSLLDSSKPFRPFGPVPAIGNRLYIGHKNALNAPLSQLAVKFQWKDLPVSGFTAHYGNYSYVPQPAEFVVKTAFLKDRVWNENTVSAALFGNGDTQQIVLNGEELKRYQTLLAETEWNHTTDHGFVRLTLAGPINADFQAFGHSTFAQEVMRNTQNGNLNGTVQQPYTPMVESLTLDYTTKEIQIGTDAGDTFYHVEPFGQLPLDLHHSGNTWFPYFKQEGTCYIGLENAQSQQSVSLFFRMVEGTADADFSQLESGINWYYLNGNSWQILEPLAISKDTTRNLLHSGIIRLHLPADMDNGVHQRMPENCSWIKLVKESATSGLDHVRGIYAQAAEVVAADPVLQSGSVSPQTMTALYEGNTGLQSVAQPYASEGGRAAENATTFYTRVSERLRHKDRGVMIWDYERLVLEAFPELYKVKCLSHTNLKTEVVAGHVTVAVIPDLHNQGLSHAFQPALSLHRRMEIYDYLRERISPFIYLHVENPVYEPIHLSFNVGFHKGYDEGFYGRKLHDTLQEFLSPWAFHREDHSASGLVFGGELYKSVVLKFIEDLDYVDFVNDFTMYHLYRDPSVAESFSTEISNVNGNYASITQSGAGHTIKLAFQAENAEALTSVMTVKVRFLNGVSQDNLPEKFIRQLRSGLETAVRKGQPITRNLVYILTKSCYYVDVISELTFCKLLPDDFLMEDTDKAVAKTARSVMVTAGQHRIGVYRAGDYKCEGNVAIGIGFMIVEADFIIPEPKQVTNELKAR